MLTKPASRKTSMSVGIWATKKWPLIFHLPKLASLKKRLKDWFKSFELWPKNCIRLKVVKSSMSKLFLTKIGFEKKLLQFVWKSLMQPSAKTRFISCACVWHKNLHFPVLAQHCWKLNFLSRVVYLKFLLKRGAHISWKGFFPSLQRVQFCGKRSQIFIKLRNFYSREKHGLLTKPVNVSLRNKHKLLLMIRRRIPSVKAFTHLASRNWARKMKNRDELLPRSFNKARKVPVWVEAILEVHKALLESGILTYINKTLWLNLL